MLVLLVIRPGRSGGVPRAAVTKLRAPEGCERQPRTQQAGCSKVEEEPRDGIFEGSSQGPAHGSALKPALRGEGPGQQAGLFHRETGSIQTAVCVSSSGWEPAKNCPPIVGPLGHQNRAIERRCLEAGAAAETGAQAPLKLLFESHRCS